ncbi:hypothetical protein HY633_01690 [Candidatus Uhrbacteria bacterium]|nr:hypothetical protein [Candidatus Uhrbacteria bacterium]
MGERYHNLLPAFTGTSIDWNGVFGAGFANVNKRWVSVYREVAIDELIRIASGGLRAAPPELLVPEIREEMELLDRFRPSSLARLGVSRVNAIYATPTPELSRNQQRRERIMLELKIDPAAAFVGDADFVTCLVPFMGVYRYGLERHQEVFRKYWQSVIPLKDFFKYYERLEAVEGFRWVARMGAPRGYPRVFFIPEVLIMSPSVSTGHIRIVQHDGQMAPEEGRPSGGH